MRDVGSMIRRMREGMGLNQKQFAAKVGLSPQYVNDLERNRRGAPHATAERILDALEAPPDVAKALIEEWSGGWLTLFRKYERNLSPVEPKEPK